MASDEPHQSWEWEGAGEEVNRVGWETYRLSLLRALQSSVDPVEVTQGGVSQAQEDDVPWEKYDLSLLRALQSSVDPVEVTQGGVSQAQEDGPHPPAINATCTKLALTGLKFGGWLMAALLLAQYDSWDLQWELMQFLGR